MSTQIWVMTANCTCLSRLPGQVTGGSLVFIKAPVGGAAPPRCRNYPDDVRTIQKALNRFTPLEGGPSPRLAVDGIVGPKTGGAIYHFQEKWDLKPKGSTKPDGIVDPEGGTIRRLRAGPGVLPNLPGVFAARIPRVMQIVTAARAALTTASTFYTLPASSLFGKAAADKMDRHFHQNKTANPLQRLNEVERMFLNMQTAIGFVPQGVILAEDEPPKIAEGAFMFTFEGGYHIRGKNETWNGIPVGSIYLCPKSRTLRPNAFAYAMVHELAHYTGPTALGIVDNAYFHNDPQKYKNLSPNEAFHNADSYAQYAFDVIGLPDFSVEQNVS